MLGNPLSGQAPNWVAPNPADFAFQMNVVGVVNFEGVVSNSQFNQVAFFVGGDIRGLATLTFIPGFGAEAYFSATIYSNVTSGETVDIQVYYQATDQVYTASNPFQFIHTSVLGSFTNPYEFLIGTPMDEDPEITPIPIQLTIEEIPFEPLYVRDFVVSTDNDPFTLSFAPIGAGVTWSLSGDTLYGVPDPGFVGDASVRLIATEQTPNALSAEQEITYRVQAEVMRPNWHPIPPQSAPLGAQFVDIDLKLEVDTLADSCYNFSYTPQFGQSPLAPPPNWAVNTTFQSTMTVTTRVQFTPSFSFNNQDDRLAAFIDGELRGVIGPTELAGESIFFLSVGNDVGTADTVRLVFYSATLRRYFSYPQLITYVPFGVMGTASNPETVDLANLIPVINPDRQLEIVIQNPDSTAFQSFEFLVADCHFPNQIQDRITVPFCYGNPGDPIQLINLSSGPAEVCQVRTLDLSTLVENVMTDGFTYTWDTSGNGDFLDANDNGDNRYEFARYYRPGSIDIEEGEVTLSLRLATGMLMDCTMEIGENEVDVAILRVGAGSFPWDGQWYNWRFLRLKKMLRSA